MALDLSNPIWMQPLDFRAPYPYMSNNDHSELKNRVDSAGDIEWVVKVEVETSSLAGEKGVKPESQTGVTGL